MNQQQITLQASSREVFGKKTKKLRLEGKIPAIVYGNSQDNQAVELDHYAFERVFASAGQNTIIALKLDDAQPLNILIQDVERDPLTGNLTHADLYRVNMTQEIKANVPLHFVGEAPAVYQQEGVLLTNLEEIEIETLPGKLPANIEVDISGLDDFEKAIHVSDLNIPEGVEVLVDGEELVAKVDPPRSEEELEALDEDIVEELPEEEGAEGEAAEGEEGGEATAEGGGEAKAEAKTDEGGKKEDK
ncbi:50S ribosomal protein L25 [Candidatus Saccharibacteria bacterium]|nr:50S ribosomal protein L25 [Candidatus Saccharibacteria bacterium]